MVKSSKRKQKFKKVAVTNVKRNSFPRNLTISDAKITEKSLIAKNLNDLSVNIE